MFPIVGPPILGPKQTSDHWAKYFLLKNVSDLDSTPTSDLRHCYTGPNIGTVPIKFFRYWFQVCVSDVKIPRKGPPTGKTHGHTDICILKAKIQLVKLFKEESFYCILGNYFVSRFQRHHSFENWPIGC